MAEITVSAGGNTRTAQEKLNRVLVGAGEPAFLTGGGWASAGKVFVFGILQRYFGEPSGYRLSWPRLGLLGIEHQG